MQRILFDAVASLPDEYREVYELRDMQERPGEEVAGQLGISLPAMKSRLHRARELMRERLDAALTRGTQELQGGSHGSSGGASGSGAV